MTGKYSLGIDPVTIDEVEREMTIINRDRKIDAILNDTEYIPLEMVETEAYKTFEYVMYYIDYITKGLDTSIDSEYIAEQLYK
jgi:hypothetical protein